MMGSSAPIELLIEVHALDSLIPSLIKSNYVLSNIIIQF